MLTSKTSTQRDVSDKGNSIAISLRGQEYMSKSKSEERDLT